MTSKVVFLLLPRLHLLDLAGPAQAFDTAANLGGAYDLRYVAEQVDVPTAQGLPLRAETTWPDLGPDDLVLVPGWRGMASVDDPPLSEMALAALRRHHRAGGTVASVCSGADILGRAGLLDGRRCTTHHDLQQALAERYPKALVQRDVLFTDHDRVVTSAGIASGIDLSLYLIAQRHGPALAARVARSMVVYARRNGEDPQDSVMLRHRSHLSDVVHHVQDLIDAEFASPLPLARLAAHGGVSERTLTRLFVASVGTTPLRYQQTLRLERAEHLIGQGWSIESAARATGFEDARMLRRLRARAG
ncbi:GlxA family transcriptional regulator [Luteipulveratus mongoliensis]|uniref:AraC family transcriptional regulator n=1 Tax=Luteipulveratus mongoliensis TaxID=571913 RepID=A0A0K1JLB7_9MICO|nr:DJ-1/PfpI family protein [Luteipulveratus mongoliensis]AKU17365.1 AraC family transcriptional regulator [Luteipulveratus mongoliensis]